MRRQLFGFVLAASFANAVPAIGQMFPAIQEPVSDELMGSGRESAASALKHNASRRPGRLPMGATPDAVRAAEARILLVEDNERLASLLEQGLTQAGFAVSVHGTAREAAGARQQNAFDLIVLDLGLPDEDGLSMLATMRSEGMTTPVMILTARSSISDRVAGLEGGADDYLVKPFNLRELLARLHALLRRPDTLLGRVLELGNVAFDTVTRQVFVDDRPVILSPGDLTLLQILLRRSGQVVPKGFLENSLYGLSEVGGLNAVEARISRLRRLLAGSEATIQVHTVRGVGYLVTENA